MHQVLSVFLDEGKVFISLVLILLPGLWKGKSLLYALCISVWCSALLLAGVPAQQSFGMLQSPQSHGKLCIAVAFRAHHAHQWTLQRLLVSSAHTSGGKDIGKMLRRSQA